MPVGAGGFPAGSTPAGYGVIDTALPPQLVPLPDPRTGKSQTGRLLNAPTATKGMDYSFTADGRLQGMPTVNQLVMIAIEDIDSSSLLGTKGPNYQAQLAQLVQNALAPYVAQKLLQIKAVVAIDGAKTPGQNPSSGIAVVYWFDLTTGRNGEPVTVPGTPT